MSESERLPITVGVVGHLDVITTEEQRLEIADFFCDLAAEYPNSPIYLFSLIAEGADRFVAKIFLDLKTGNEQFKRRFELIVPVPFSAEEYKKDFNSASQLEFDDLVNQAKRSFCIGCDDNELGRPEQYLKAGKFVADSSIILIALWDGEEGKKGGTADIVRHKITGDNEDVAESTFEYDGTVFILPSNRINSSTTIVPDPDRKLSLDIVLKVTAIKKALEKIEELNSESLNISESKFEKSRADLFNSLEKLDAPQNSLLNQYELMNVIYSRAESKAIETETYNLDNEKKNSYLKELFFVVGKEALIENGNWYLIFKEREPEIRGI